MTCCRAYINLQCDQIFHATSAESEKFLDLRDMQLCHLQGSAMYFARGFFPIMYKDLLPRTFRLCNAIGFGVGSLMFMIGGYLLILRMIVREDDPELDLHLRLQGGDEEALNGKLLAMAEVSA